MAPVIPRQMAAKPAMPTRCKRLPGAHSGEPSPHRCRSVLNLALRLNQPHKLMICFAMPMHTYICGRAQRCGTCVTRTWPHHDTHTASGSQWLSLVSPAHIAIAELYYSGIAWTKKHVVAGADKPTPAIIGSRTQPQHSRIADPCTLQAQTLQLHALYMNEIL